MTICLGKEGITMRVTEYHLVKNQDGSWHFYDNNGSNLGLSGLKKLVEEYEKYEANRPLSPFEIEYKKMMESVRK
jgi:hypothetical protein